MRLMIISDLDRDDMRDADPERCRCKDYGEAYFCPMLKNTMSMLETKWFVWGWTEPRVRDEIRLAIDQLNFDVNRRFHEAANAPTIDWFNSSPEWKLVHDARTDGKWKWVKE